MADPLNYIRKTTAPSSQKGAVPVKADPLRYISKKKSSPSPITAQNFTNMKVKASGDRIDPNKTIPLYDPNKKDLSTKVSEFVKEQSRNLPTQLNNFTQWSSGKSKAVVASVLDKDSTLGKYLSTMKGGIDVAKDSSIPLRDKIKAVAEAVPQTAGGLKSSVVDFGKIVVPKSGVTAIKMIADLVDRDGAESQYSVLNTPLNRAAQPYVERGAEYVSSWANGVIDEFENQQRQSLENQGITADSSIADPRKFGYALGSGLSSIAAYLGVTALTKNPAVASAVLGWTEGSETYNRALDQIVSENPGMNVNDAEKKAAALAMTDATGIALLEKVGMDALFRTYAGGPLKNAVIGSITESAQETTQTVWSNAVEKYGYNGARGLFDDVFETIFTTMPIGFLAGGAFRDSDPTANIIQNIVDAEKDPVKAEEKAALAEVVIPIIQEEAQKIEAEVKNPDDLVTGQEAFMEDIRTQVEEKGKDKVIKDLANPAETAFPFDDEASARKIVDDALAEVTKVTSKIEDDMAKALETVRASKTPKTELGTTETPKAVVDTEKIKKLAEEAKYETQNPFATKPSAEVRDELQKLESQLDTTEGSERAEVVRNLNVAREAFNRNNEKDRESVFESHGTKIDVVKFSDGRWGYSYSSQLSDRGTSTPFGTETFKDKDEAFDMAYWDVLGWLDNQLLRNDLPESGKKQVENVKKELQKMVTKVDEDGIMDGNEKETVSNRNTRGTVRPDADSKGGVDGREGQGERRDADSGDREGVARERRDERGGESGKRPTARVKLKPATSPTEEVAKLEEELRGVYLSTPALGDGYVKADEVFSEIMTSLELAEAGQRVFVEGEIRGVPSTFPSWVPDTSRRRDALDYMLSVFEDVRTLSYPRGTNEDARRLFADAILDEMDKRLDVDTRELRNKILSEYEKNTIERPGPTEESTRRDERLHSEAQERAESTGYSRDEIEKIVKDFTEVKNGEVVLTRESTEEIREIVSNYVPAGGMASKGAEGRRLLDEYYTPFDVIEMVMKMLSKEGVFSKNITVLEPSSGIGNFLNAVPTGNTLNAIEVDSLSAGIAKILHPETKVMNQPFEALFMDDRGNRKAFTAEYDLVIGNPPYGKHRGTYKGLGEEPKLSRYETYFIKRALDITKPGGHVALVVPSSFLRTGPKEPGKTDIAKLGRLVTAVRLPNGTFETTDIGTDILVFERNDADLKVQSERVRDLSDDYFFTTVSPQNILGEQKMVSGRFGEEPAVVGTLDDAVQIFDGLYPEATSNTVDTPQSTESNLMIEAREYKSAEEFVKAQTTYYRGGAKGKWITKNPDFAKEYGKVSEYVLTKKPNLLQVGFDEADEIANKLKVDPLDLYYNPSKELDVELRARGYDGFENEDNIYIANEEILKTKSQLTDIWNEANADKTLEDVQPRMVEAQRVDTALQNEALVQSGIQVGDEVKQYSFSEGEVKEVSGVVTKDDGSSVKRVKDEHGGDAVWNENWMKKDVVVPETKAGTLDLLTLTPKESIESGLWEYTQPDGTLAGDFDKSKAFYMAGKWYNEFNYLQGNIYTRLDQLEKDKGELDEDTYSRQKEALESVLPTRMTVERMNVAPHARFVETLVLYGDKTLQKAFLEWIKKLPRTAFGESSYYDIENYTKSVPVRGGDVLQNEKSRRVRRIEGDRLFHRFLIDELSPVHKKLVEDEFNRAFNGYYRPDYSKVPLSVSVADTYKGSRFKLRDVQRQGIGFILNHGSGLIAHDVGIGKTIQGIIANFEMLERGYSKRPLIVVPNTNVYKQWVKDIKSLRPGTVVNELSNLGGDFKGDIETLSIPEGSISIVTEEGFKKLGFKDETYADLTRDMLDVIENPNDKKTKRQEELEKSKAEENIGKGKKGTKTSLSFEDLGFDAITVDEIHNANHIISKAKMGDKGQVSEYRGFTQMPSVYGLKLWLASQYIQKKMNGRNVIGLSATPFTNHPLEYYSILSLFARNQLREMGILNVNDFMTMFMDVSTKLEFKADGTYSDKSEVRSMKNYQQWQQLLTRYVDFRGAEGEADIKRPVRQTREYIVGENALSVQYRTAAQELFERTEEAGMLQGIGELRRIAFSPYISQYYKGGMPDVKTFVEGSPKLRTALDLVQKTYRDIPQSKQLVYSTIGVEYFPLLKEYLVKYGGFKTNEVEIISGQTPKEKRAGIQERFNSGDVKVVFGSDAIQEGVNLQENTTDLYMLSQPWNFTAVRQVIGRAWRQGNNWKNVRINQIFTENSIDIFLAQKLQNKERRYEESLKHKADTLDVGDIDYEEMKHQLLTDPVARVVFDFDMKTKELTLEKSREESEFAYANRKNEQFIKVYEKLQDAKRMAALYPTSEWGPRSVKDAEVAFQEKLKELTERGVDVENLKISMEASAKKIAAIEAELASLPEKKAIALENAKLERQNKLDVSRETDYKKIVDERAQDNVDLFLQGSPRFQERLVSEAVAGKARIDRVYKYRMTAATFEEARQQLENYKQRFNLEFDVDLVDKIFKSPKKDAIKDETQAYGVYFDRAVMLTPEVRKTTADHEFVHLVLNNLDSIESFRGFRKDELLTAINNGHSIKGYTETQKRVLEEKLANGFEDYLARRSLLSNSLLGKFYSNLRDALKSLWKSLGGSFDAIDAFYTKLATGDDTEGPVTFLAPDPRAQALVKFKTSEGIEYADFSKMLATKIEDDSASRAVFFDELMTNKVFQNENTLNFIMKDINTLEDMTAQARDLYLKDPEQFQAADMIEHIGDKHDSDKELLDRRFAEMISPYMKLKDTDRERVDKALWLGDELGKEFNVAELVRMSLSETAINAYLQLRDAFLTAHELLLLEMIRKGIDQNEIDTFRRERAGYMPHKWKYPFVVKFQRKVENRGSYETWNMESFKSEKDALARQAELQAEETDPTIRYAVDKLQSLEVDFFSSLELSSERILAVIEQMRAEGFVKDHVVEILKKNLMDMFKEKGFGRHFLRRAGIKGFDTENTPKITADYFSGFSGYLTKMRWSGEYFQVLSQIDARRQPRFFSWMRDLVAYKLNNSKEWQWIRTVSFAWYLANDLSYLLTNALQNVLVGTGELSKYVDGADKVWKPEAYLMKALTDWTTQRNITPTESALIQGLIEKGQLGAEMSSELMGFKNNPIYNEISSRFSKIMYGSTAIVEKNFNRIPAFLAAYRVFIEQGTSSQVAALRALEVSNDIHFRYGRHHRPRLMRGRVNVLFVFQNYLRSYLYQLYRDASRREFIALTRKMMYLVLLGGTTALPFAKLVLSILGALGDDEDDEELKEEVSRWKIALTRGIPALFDVDLSSRIGVEMLSVNKIFDAPTDVRSYLGVIGDLLFKRPGDVVGLVGQERYLDATAKLLPDVFANPIRAITGYLWGVRSINGVPLEDHNGDLYKYSTWEAIIKATGFTPTMEGLLWDEKAKEWDRTTKAQEESAEVGRTIRGQIQRGEIDKARETQAQAIAEGTISGDTDYVRKYAGDVFIADALLAWSESTKSRAALKKIEEELITKMYNGVATDQQRNNIRKEFAVYRQFGPSNEYVDDIMGAKSNKDKVDILLKMDEELGEESFNQFIKDGRTRIVTEAGNRVPILISDDLLEEFNKAKRDAAKN